MNSQASLNPPGRANRGVLADAATGTLVKTSRHGH
jgi:hypothetical protein